MRVLDDVLCQSHQLLEKLVSRPGKIFIALSGGLDSSCLVHMVHAWCMSQGLSSRMVLVHIDHQIQSESVFWSAHCASLANRLAVSYHSFKADVVADGRGLESAARDARWRIFKDIVSTDDVLLLGHHANDQIETGLYRMLRGSGLSGMQLMQPIAVLYGVTVFRPLLHWSRDQLQRYACEQGVSFVEDPSNDSDSFDRNYLRHNLVPAFSTRWPRFVSSMMRTFSHLQTDWELLQHYARKDLSHMGVHVCGLAGIDHKKLLLLSSSQQSLMLRLCLLDRGWYLPSSQQMDDFLGQLNRARPDHAIRLETKQWVMQLSLGTVFFYRANCFSIKSPDLPEVFQPQLTLFCPNRLTIDASSVLSLKLTQCSMRWVYRSMLSGRALRLCNRFFSKNGVPIFMRDCLPLLDDQEGGLFFPDIVAVEA